MRGCEVDNGVGRHQDVAERAGEAWIGRRNEQRFRLGTEEASEE